MPRKRRPSVQADKLFQALEHLDRYVIASDVLQETRGEFLSLPTRNLQDKNYLEQHARVWMSLADAMKAAGRITRAAHIYLSATMLLGIHDQRVTEGEYDAELNPILSRIKLVERAHGLTEDEFWPTGEGPPEYETLSAEFDAVLDQKQAEVFREFGKPWLAELLERDRGDFYGLLVRGSDDFFKRTDQETRLKEFIEIFESEARSCAEVGAFHSACSSLGAAAEARLLLYCLKNPQDTQAAYEKLTGKLRQSSKNPLDWDLNTLLMVCARAGWLSPIESELGSHLPEGWGHHLRNIRNLLHPSRFLKDQVVQAIERREFDTAHAAYVLIKSQLG